VHPEKFPRVGPDADLLVNYTYYFASAVVTTVDSIVFSFV